MRPGVGAWALALTIALGPACAARRPAPSTVTADAASASPAVRQLRSDLSRVFGARLSSRTAWAVDVRSLDRRETLFRIDADRLAMPASNMKIVTLATAAEILGWDFRFTTTLETSAPIEGGVLRGDLFIRSTGDPTVNQRNGRAAAVIQSWVDALKTAGINAIDGQIVGDDQAFDDEWLGAGWAWDYLQYGYAAPVGALQFNENLARLTIAPGAAAGDPVVITLSPGTGLTIENRAVTGAEGTGDTIDYRRRLDRPALEITGSFPFGAGAATRPVSVVNPTIFSAQSIRDALVERGIEIRGAAVDLDDIAAELVGAPERRVLASTESPPLRETASVMMKVSQNLYAETLMKAIGAARGGLGTIAGGRARVQETLTAWGLPDHAWVLADGSGLSRYNYISAAALTTILERMHGDPRHRDAFAATLPIAGRDGTLAARMRRTRAENNATAKTGSISNVRALSGYVRTRDGELLAFAIVANDFVLPAAMVTWIADLAVEHLANFTRH